MSDLTETSGSFDGPVNPQRTWEQLREGNQRFVQDRSERPLVNQERRTELREGQSPSVVVLSCSDSRVPVELVFDMGLGEAFVIRTAGHIVDNTVMASLEYAIENLGVSLIVVMGHQGCGAVDAAASVIDERAAWPSGFQRVIIEKIALSVLGAQRQGDAQRSGYEREHTRETVRQLLSRAPVLHSKIVEGTIGVVGTRYRLDDGSIEPVVLHGVH